jgi:HAE1 family hydrophobic/amphiphilic exporter-1
VVVTSEQLAKFEQAVLPIPEGARMTSTTFGNQAVIRIRFEDELLSTEHPTRSRLALIDVADATGGSSIFIRGFSDRPYFKGPFSGSALNSLIKITGYNSKRLNEMADAALARLDRQRRVRNARVSSGRRFDRSFTDETVLTIDRDKLAEHDLSVVEVVGHVRRLIGVDTPWSMLIEGERKRMQLTFEDAETIEYSDVAAQTITNRRGERVKLMDLVSLETQPVKGAITRENQRYTMFVNWEYIGTDKMRRNYIQQTMNRIDTPYGYAVEEARQEFFTQEEEEELTLMAVLAVVFIFMVLAALFESVSLPLMVLISLPMALLGVFLAFWITDSSFDSSARIGLILLFGVVVNNAILLVSRFRTEAALILKARLGGDPEGEGALFPGLRKQLGGSDLRRLPRSERPRLLRRAVARGTRVRLRSIFLTSSTTIVGLAPLLVKFRESESEDIWENLALSSIGGLITSTILIVLALPPLYYAVIRFRWGAERFFGWMGQGARRVFRRGEPAGEPAAATRA